MDEPILHTKLFIPSARRDIVARPVLLSRLERGLQGKLTLLSAPAGFGKTTLLTAWVAWTEHPVCWVSLDTADNDVMRFLAYLIAALQTYQPSLGGGALAMGGTSRHSSVVPMLTLILNDLAQLEQNLVLVLDDYHVIQTPEIHEALTFLLEHLPSQLHVMIATRADPPFPLSRFRARGQLTEFRATDLRFNPQETTIFLSDIMALPLSTDDIQTLTARTEGWIAGLQMAALSLQRREDTHTFIESFTGSHEFVADYLTDEVLTQQSDDYRRFLLRTAILDRLSGPLCEAVTGQPDSAQILSQLNDANLFVVRLDDRRQWYRYHHLFADLLRQRLHNYTPDLVPILHRRASQWYEEQEMFGAAINHAFSANDTARAASLVEQVADRMMIRSEIMTLLQWMEQLPPEELRARPLLSLYHAGAQLMAGYPLDEVTLLLSEMMSEDVDAPSGELAAIQALIASFQGKTTLCRTFSQQALEHLPKESQFMRSLVAQNLGFACAAVGDAEQAIRVFHEAAAIARQANSPLVSVISLSHIAELQVAQGHLRAAHVTYKRALELATDAAGKRLPIAGMPLIGLAELLREQDQLDAALQSVKEGLRLTKHWSPINTLEGHITLARIYETLGKSAEADDELATAQDHAAAFDATEMDDLMVAYHRARIWILRGDPGTAREWLRMQEAQARGTEQGDSPPDHFFIELLRLVTYIRLELASNQPEKALELLELHQEKASAHGVWCSVIEGCILQALAFDALGAAQRAMESLQEALTLAEHGGFVRRFVDEGPPLARLLYEAVAQDIYSEFAGRLLAAFPASLGTALPSPDGLIEPLSERETEILSLIAKGLTNQEIANQLVVSLRTIKWHTSNIYSKLEVKNRTEAAARARELGIISTD